MSGQGQGGTTEHSIQDLALKLAAVVDLLDQRVQQAAQTSAGSAQEMRDAAQNMSQQGQQIAATVLNTVNTQARQAIEQGTAQSLEQLRQQLHKASESAAQSSKTLNEQLQALRQVQQALTWKMGATLMFGALLAAGGTAYVAWRSMEQVARADFAEDILRATKNGTLTRCGKNLCAKVGKQPKTFGRNSEYVLLEE